ncbi:hypothetical protein BLS_000723 [Venturia inaequalis]|uniref:Aminoglycoside phosphotransferase domain-containing protein n=1 Tax=Venturia inaequalis TaxID=5025 RepID=A0A8H3UW24_VENIN|nr:hypothetical protein BLS_000723 [Venturia inaequalis]
MFTIGKRFTNPTKSAPGHATSSSEERKTQPKESKLKRLLSRKPRQQQASEGEFEETLPNRVVPIKPIQPPQDAVDSPSGTRNNPAIIPQRKMTIRMVQPSLDQIHGPHKDPVAARNSADESSISSHADPDDTLIGDDEGERAIWGPPLFSPDAKLEALAMEYAPSQLTTSAHVVRWTKGHNSNIAVMQYEPSGGKCVIKIPACGWGSKWTENDKTTLERFAETMRYVKGKTKIAIPAVLGYDAEVSNTMGAPYMILEFIDGQDPLKLWWGHSATGRNNKSQMFNDEGHSDDEAEIFGGFYRKVSPGLEEKRQRILRSLAFAMAELRSLKFDKLGTFAPTKGGTPPTIESTNLPSFGTRGDGQVGRFSQRYKQRRTFNSSRAWLESCLGRYMDDIKSHSVRSYRARDAADLQEDLELKNGLHKLYRLLIAELPLSNLGEQETFVLGLRDFGSRNILVDGEGKVTGILDWNRVETRPQYLGWTVPPDWLFSDFTSPRPDRDGRTERSMTPFEHIRYRDDYARYLREASGTDSESWKYSTKNYIYSMIVEGIANLDETKMADTLIMVLSMFMPANIQFRSFIRQIGKPNQMEEEMEEYLKGQFRKVLGTEERCVAQREDTQVIDQDQPGFNESIVSQQSYTQMHSAQKDGQQNFLMPESSRQRGNQIVNSPIPNTSGPFHAYRNNATQPSTVQTLPQNPTQSSKDGMTILQPPGTSILPIRPRYVPDTPAEQTHHQQEKENLQSPVSPKQQNPPTQALPTATAVKTVQTQHSTPEIRLAGEWPVKAKDHLFAERIDHQPNLQRHTTQVPNAVAENLRPQRDSREILRMAGSWPIDGSRNLLFEAEEGLEKCVML